MNYKANLADDHIEELSKRVGRIKEIGIALDEDLREDNKLISGVDQKTGHLLTGLSKTSQAVDTLKRHEWLKLGKLLLFFLFVLALLLHYLHRFGFFSLLYHLAHSQPIHSHHKVKTEGLMGDEHLSGKDEEQPL